METKTISEEELKLVEQEVNKKQAEMFKSKSDELAKDIESKVRKEMEAKLETDRLKEQIKKQEEEFKKFKDEQEGRIKAQEESFKRQIEDSLATKKGISTNESPFTDNNPNLVTLHDGKQIDVTKLDHDEIEEQSRQAFMQRFGIQDPNFGKAQIKYR
jgi:septal ring factor EnvC (AmiA/AmiB activator)